MSTRSDQTVALYMPTLVGAGAERVMLNLARGLIAQGVTVDLVVANALGDFTDQVPAEARLIDLGSKRGLLSLPGLMRYLRAERPAAVLSALDRANLVAIWAKLLSGSRARLYVSVHIMLSIQAQRSLDWRTRLFPLLARWFYPFADRVVAVSQGVADDLAMAVGVPRSHIEVIYNPVKTPEMLQMAEEPVTHPWFAPGGPPVILGLGRLVPAKEFATLIRAFARLRAKREARLVILGEGPLRPELEAIVNELGLERDVALPGFVINPYAYLARSSLLAFSSSFEGLPTVLIEAMALGCPVVSTDCPSGPTEILDGGRYGALVPIGDEEALEAAMAAALDRPADRAHLQSRSDVFSLEASSTQYRRLMLNA